MDSTFASLDHVDLGRFIIDWTWGRLLMKTYPLTLEESQKQLIHLLDESNITYHLEQIPIITNLQIFKFIIPAKQNKQTTLVFTSGLHGIEGYVGHMMLETFITQKLPQLHNTEVIIYHPINPFGMAYYRRVNEENVDLNRNFSTNHFTSSNEDYLKALRFFKTKPYSIPFFSNIRFLMNVIGALMTTGVHSFKRATLLGQHVLEEGIYYQGNQYQKSTEYMMNEIKTLISEPILLIWIDLHTGYGPKDEMSMVNSTHEKMAIDQCKTFFDYPRVTTLDQDDFYQIDGDMIEYIYDKKPENKDVFATCFEFGTKKEGLWQQIQSLKALMFENASYHKPMTRRFKIYAKDLMLAQFRPKDELWLEKAIKDFIRAYDGIANHKQIK